MERNTLELARNRLFIKKNKIHRYFGKKIANTISELTSPFILRTDTQTHCRMDIHAILESMGGLFRKKVWQETLSQAKFP